MNRIFAAAIIIITFAAQFASAQSPRNRLYKVSSDRGDSYILGTMHFGIGLNEFNTDIPSLIKKSRVLMPEIDFNTEQLKLYKTDPFRAIFSASPVTAKGDLDRVTVAKLIALGFPSYIAETLSDNSCMSLDVLLMARPGQPSLDLQVLDIAHQNNLKIRALDTAELRHTARQKNDSEVGACSLRQILNAYTNEQIVSSLEASLREEIISYKKGEPESEALLNSPIVKFRNQAWIAAVEEEILKGGAFISVGEAHISGPDGILQLLKDRGFRITLVE